jgi:TadE-like protein
VIRRGHPAGSDARRGERGQSLVEFSMIVPLFLLFLLGLLEFGMVFDHVLTISYASREGARTGAALANGSKMADESLGTCSDVDSYVVAAVERVLDSPGSPVHGDLSDVSQIRIYKATSTGTESGPVNVWTPGSGPTIDGKDLSFSRSSYGWDSCTRNNKTSNPDSLGVSISYTYHAVTPLASLMRFFGGPGWTQLPVTDRSVMALNPTD